MDPAVQEELQEDPQIARRGVHSAPGMSHVAPVRRVGAEPLHVLRRLELRGDALTPCRLSYRPPAETEGAALHAQRIEDLSFHELAKRCSADSLHDLAGEENGDVGVLEGGPRSKE